MRRLRIVVADDNALLREGIASLLVDAGHEVVGRAVDADDLLLKVRSYTPDAGEVFVGGRPLGATGTLFIELSGTNTIDALHDRLRPSAHVVMPLVTQFYGLREFAIEDPDGYVITFAQRVG